MSSGTPLLLRICDDAIAHRTPEGWCRDCGETEAGICPACAANYALAEEYREERMRIYLRHRQEQPS